MALFMQIIIAKFVRVASLKENQSQTNPSNPIRIDRLGYVDDNIRSVVGGEGRFDLDF
jgi:hypothetical protein